MQLNSNGFNNIQSESFNSCANDNGSRNAKKFANPFKFKCETSQIFRRPFKKKLMNTKRNS
jgi:hypothetical protein